MKRFRISIGGAMGCVLVAGLVFTLVRVESRITYSAPEGWANAARYLAVTLLVIATYRARYGTGREADWWFGFALGGWSYYVLSGDMHSQWSFPTHQPRSLIEGLPRWIVGLIPREWWDRIVIRYHLLPVFELQSYLARTVQALLVLVAASIGGLVGLVLSRRRCSPGR